MCKYCQTANWEHELHCRKCGGSLIQAKNPARSSNFLIPAMMTRNELALRASNLILKA